MKKKTETTKIKRKRVRGSKVDLTTWDLPRSLGKLSDAMRELESFANDVLCMVGHAQAIKSMHIEHLVLEAASEAVECACRDGANAMFRKNMIEIELPLDNGDFDADGPHFTIDLVEMMENELDAQEIMADGDAHKFLLGLAAHFDSLSKMITDRLNNG